VVFNNLPHLDHDHRAVILRADAPDVFGERGADGLHDLFGCLVTTGLHGVRQAFQAEFFVGVIAHFHDAVGVEDQDVAGLELQGRLFISRFRKKAQWDSADIQKRRLSGSHEQRIRQAGIRERDGACLRL
jgi:hypothetical protein